MSVREPKRIEVITIPDTTLGSQFRGTPTAGVATLLTLSRARVNDYALVHATQRTTTGTIADPAGWTQLARGQAGSGVSTYLWGKRIDGTEPIDAQNNPQVSLTSTVTNNAIYSGLVLREVDEVTPLDVAVVNGTAQAWQNTSWPRLVVGGNLVPVTPETLVIIFEADISGSGIPPAATRTITSLDDEIQPEKFVDATQGVSLATGMMLAMERRPTPGPINRHIIQIGDGVTQYSAHTCAVALRPRIV